MAGDRSQIITFANIKGGVGKTTAVVNIAYLLAVEMKKRVLVIDSDDQGNASKALGIRDQHDLETESLWYALKHKKSYRDVMVESAYEGIWVVPSTKDLKGAQLAFGQSVRGIRLFQKLLKQVEKDFDFVLIDTKPQINILLQSALAASTWYLIPSFPEPDSYDGFIDLLAEAGEIQEEFNERLACLGVLLTSVKKIPAHETYLAFISKQIGLMRKSHIRSSNSMATGSLHSCPAVSLPGSYNIKEDYMKIVRVILRQVAKNKSSIMIPNLEVLGISGPHEEFGLEVNDGNEQVEL